MGKISENNMTQILELTAGREYQVRLYPTNEEMKARYIGQAIGTRVFRNDNVYLFVESNELQTDHETVSHISLSRMPIRVLRKENAEFLKSDSLFKHILINLKEK